MCGDGGFCCLKFLVPGLRQKTRNLSKIGADLANALLMQDS